MKTTLLFTALLISALLGAQGPWNPTGSPPMARYDDISFITPDTGWAAGTSPSGNGGFICHTTNGGQSWTSQQINNVYMRSVEFADKNLGFAGALDNNGQHIFYRTTNGGVTWTNISSVITGTARGICGICCVNTSVTYAVGAWSTPAYVMKTTDGGLNWTQVNMGAYANALIDVQFTDANNGYVTGQSNVAGEGAVILKTTDGGSTWAKVYTSGSVGEYVWKIQNLDGQNWFASIEEAVVNYNDSVNNVFLKSTNGGNTWTAKPVAHTRYFQGIGFMTPLRGWIGNNDLYETNDGGDTWAKISSDTTVQEFDRFQKVNSTTAYFSSEVVYKLGTPTGIKQSMKPEKKPWLSVYPNPVKEQVSFRLELPVKTMFYARLLNADNEVAWEMVDQKEKGAYHFSVDKKLPPGIYYVYVMFNEGVECQKVLVE